MKGPGSIRFNPRVPSGSPHMGCVHKRTMNTPNSEWGLLPVVLVELLVPVVQYQGPPVVYESTSTTVDLLYRYPAGVLASRVTLYS